MNKKPVILDVLELKIGKIYYIDANRGDIVTGILPKGFVKCPSPSQGYIPYSEWSPKSNPAKEYIYNVPLMTIVMYLGKFHGISFLDLDHEHHRFLHNDKVIYMSRSWTDNYMFISTDS